MDLNKRMLIALVLTTIILIVWQMFFFKPVKKTVDNISDTTVIVGETVSMDTLAQNVISNNRLEENKKPIIENTIEDSENINIDTIKIYSPIYRIEILNKGGALTNFYVNKYKSNKGNILNILKGEAQTGIDIFYGNSRVSLNDLIFSYNKRIIDLDGKNIDTLLLEWNNDSLSINIGYIFRKDNYKIDIFYSIDGIEVDWVNFNFNNGLAYEKKYKKTEIASTKAFANLGGTVEKYSSKELKKGDISYVGHSSFVGVRNTYFTSMFSANPDDVRGYNIHYIEEGALSFNISNNYKRGEINNISLYIGPLDYKLLKSMGDNYTDILDWGWKIIAPIGKIILNVMLFIQNFIHNYGITIIVLAIFLFALFFPLTLTSFRSARKMQEIQPEVNELKVKYKSNPQKLNQATMDLYKKKGVNPFSGCFPILLQMPVFFALYQVLRSTIELKCVHFLWMKDLTAPDPYYILPILMGISMFIQQKFSNVDPKQKYFTYFMPIFMVFIFLNFPAGLTLYWLTYNLLSLLQLYIIHLEVINEKKNRTE
jgi:YidC/Oxa1 family membrane protein insertase